MKKTIAVLSMSLAATLGLAACGNTVKAPSESQSASASTSGSVSVSASASDSASTVSTSSKAPGEHAPDDHAPDDHANSEDAAPESNEGDDSSSQTVKKNYESLKNGLEEAKKDPSTKKSTNTDGTVYSDPNGALSIVEAANGDYILIRNDGAWMRASLDGSLSTVDEHGTWSTINPNGDIVAVQEDGTASIFNSKTGASSTNYDSLELPKPPAPVGGYSTQPKEGVKPTNAA